MAMRVIHFGLATLVACGCVLLHGGDAHAAVAPAMRQAGHGREDAEALLDPERRQAALCRLLEARRYHSKPPYDEMPCAPVNDVVVLPQPNGGRRFMVFRNEPVPDEGIGPGRTRGGFTIFDAQGFIIPVEGGANHFGAGDRVFAPSGTGPMVMVQVYGHGGGDAFGPDGWTVQVLHVTPLWPGARTLAVVLGPATYGFEDGCLGYSWWWQARDVDGDGIEEIEIGPRVDADNRIAPRAVYRWSTSAGRYAGPSGSVEAGFLRLPDGDCRAVGSAAEAFARAQRRRGVTHEPSAVRGPECRHGDSTIIEVTIP